MNASHHPAVYLAAVIATGWLLYSLVGQIRINVRRRRMAAEHGCKPCNARYPYKVPYFALDLLLENLRVARDHNLLPVVKERFDRIGKTFVTSLIGQPVVATCEPQIIKTILSLKFKDYILGSRQLAFGPLLGHGIFTTDGESWAHSRAMLRPNFAREQVADLEAFERHIQRLFKLIPRDGSTVDLQELFFRFTLDTATEFLFGHSVDSLRPTVSGNDADVRFSEAFNYSQAESSNRFRMGSLALLHRDKAFDESIKIVHEFVDQFVDDAVEYRKSTELGKGVGDRKPRSQYLFLRELAEATADKRRIRDELLNVLLAGRDSTASLLSNMFFEVAKRPEIWAKLREEAAQLDGQLPTYEQLRNLKYLKNCLNESLRLHPVVPGNFRTAAADTVLPLGGGADGQSPMFVRKGTLVVYSVYTMHRRKDLYGEDAEIFRPERWDALRPGWEYLPFNGGPRICLGQQFALTEASYVTIRMLQEFSKLESRDPGPWREKLTLTVCSLNGTKVALTPA